MVGDLAVWPSNGYPSREVAQGRGTGEGGREELETAKLVAAAPWNARGTRRRRRRTKGPPPWLGALLLAAGSAGLDRIGARGDKRDFRCLPRRIGVERRNERLAPFSLLAGAISEKGGNGEVVLSPLPATTPFFSSFL